MPKLSTPDKDAIALLPPFDHLDLSRIALVQTAEQAQVAANTLVSELVWGFDTESKPRFRTTDAADGPHVVQLACPQKTFVFQLHNLECKRIVGQLLAHKGIVKAGFGLRDDRKQILHTLGVDVADMLDLNQEFSALGYRKEVGVKDAVAVLFGQQFSKSKRVATSNWANAHLSDSQLVYAANDAYAALRVHQGLREIR